MGVAVSDRRRSQREGDEVDAEWFGELPDLDAMCAERVLLLEGDDSPLGRVEFGEVMADGGAVRLEQPAFCDAIYEERRGRVDETGDEVVRGPYAPFRAIAPHDSR